MKKINIYLFKASIVGALMVAITTSCKKEEIKVDPVAKTEKLSKVEFSKLLQFISITTNAPKDKIVYNEKDKEFIIYGWYHKSLADGQSEYNVANEYKAKYER